jgi:peptidyl-prolyl cis-trans isomerase D
VTEGKDGVIFMVRVSKVIPPTIKPLAEVKDQAVAAWQADKRSDKVAKTAEELAAAVKPGARLATVATEKSLKVATSPPLLRRPGGVDAKLQTTPPALVAKLFEAKPDEVVIAADAAGSYVAQLGEVQVEETPSKSATVDLSLQLNQGMRTDLVAEFTQALRARFPVEIRREAVDQVF